MQRTGQGPRRQRHILNDQGAIGRRPMGIAGQTEPGGSVAGSLAVEVCSRLLIDNEQRFRPDLARIVAQR